MGVAPELPCFGEIVGGNAGDDGGVGFFIHVVELGMGPDVGAVFCYI